MSPDEARERFASARCARLATADADGKPHIVPLVFALDGDTIYSAVDPKPKRTQRPQAAAQRDGEPAGLAARRPLRRRRLGRPLVGARRRHRDACSSRSPRAAELLRERYAQYADAPPDGPVLAIAVQRWSGWAA